MVVMRHKGRWTDHDVRIARASFLDLPILSVAPRGIMDNGLASTKPILTSRLSLRAQQSRTRAGRSLTTIIADEKACLRGSLSLSAHRQIGRASCRER